LTLALAAYSYAHKTRDLRLPDIVNVGFQEWIEKLESEIRRPGDSTALRESGQATLGILKERLVNQPRREASLAEIDRDLVRIEAQADLMLDHAAIHGKPEIASTDIELATNLAGASTFGDAEGAVADLDQTYNAPHRMPERN
jgi:hypothetical protein